jgi:transposase
MIRQEVWMDVKLMHRQGMSIREISRTTGCSRQLVRRVLSEPAPRGYKPRPVRPSKLDPFCPQLEALLKLKPRARATVIHDLLKKEGYPGGYGLVKAAVGRIRREEAARQRACVRFETAPGLEGQFDWKGPIRGLLGSDSTTAVYLFRFVLAWSRSQFTLAVTSLALSPMLASLRWAFEEIGGVPHRLVLDNPKPAVTRPKPHLVLHRFFLEFCRHYGCEPDPAWPYHPERKGKTERTFQDVEQAGLLDVTYSDLPALQRVLTALDESRMKRVHGTTGQAPAVRLIRELPELLPLPAGPFDARLPEVRRVLSDCTVRFQTGAYSVPHTLVGSRVVVKADPLGDGIEIFAGAERVASHVRVPRGGRIVLEEHVAELRRPRLERLKERAEKRRPKAAPVIRSVVPWPAFDVAVRPIEEYAAVAGGDR